MVITTSLVKPDKTWNNVEPGIEYCEIYRSNSNVSYVYLRFSNETRRTHIKPILSRLGIYEYKDEDFKSFTLKEIKGNEYYILIQEHKGQPGYDDWGAKKQRAAPKRSSDVEFSPNKRKADQADVGEKSSQSIKKFLFVTKFFLILA
jgi:hypothetical protein